MDQNNIKHGLINSNDSIDIVNDVVNTNKNEKKKAARKRWAILAKALKSPSGSEPSSPTDEFSVRRISSFMLLTTQLLENAHLVRDPFIADRIRKRTWYKYSMRVQNVEYFINVGHRIRTFSAEDLMGFNNTGNVCIWPSEETLTYYIGTNLNLFKNKSVLELGGGMSCLAGLICAKYGAAKYVHLTDGNKISIENVQTSLYRNEFSCPVDCKLLKWEDYDCDEKFDIILCADCLFFDEGRIHLIECMWKVMSVMSLALVMAPKRGNTLENFIIQAQERGFICRKIIKYNNVVWEKHLGLLDNCEYNENIHYPILIEVTKSQVSLGLITGSLKKENIAIFATVGLLIINLRSPASRIFFKCLEAYPGYWCYCNSFPLVFATLHLEKSYLESIEFHEKGRRHKENVSKRLRSIQKQSRREERESIKVGCALQRMESAALEAYRKDVEANADLTSLAINKKVKDDNLVINSAKKLWHEAKSPIGETYYWNILTNESVWKSPSEGYLSIIEQKEAALDTARKQLKAIHKHELVQERVRSQEEKKQEEEERARLAREKMKERRVEDLPIITPGPIISAEKLSPYGQWKTVKISEHIDLQLPQQAEPEPFIPEPMPEPVVREFKEKVIETLGTSNVGFRKRKIGSGAKYNTRKRLDDE